jgi:hypothetical protein
MKKDTKSVYRFFHFVPPLSLSGEITEMSRVKIIVYDHFTSVVASCTPRWSLLKHAICFSLFYIAGLIVFYIIFDHFYIFHDGHYRLRRRAGLRPAQIDDEKLKTQ